MNNLKSEFDFYKLKKWVKVDNLHWWRLVLKKDAIPFIEKHIHLIQFEDKKRLSRNPFAIPILRKYPEKISWNDLVENPNCIDLIEEHIDVCFKHLSWNGKIELLGHPNFIYLINKYSDKIVDELLSIDCLPTIARIENVDYLNLLDKYMTKYPNKLPSHECEYFWGGLVKNPNALYIIKKYLHEISSYAWQILASNPNAVSIIEENLEQLNEQGWNNLSKNINAIPLLKKHIDKINWFNLSNNKNGGEIFEEYPEKIQCYSFLDYDNFSINSPIFEYDYDAIKKRCFIIKEELMQVALHPSRIKKYLEYGISIEELDNYI